MRTYSTSYQDVKNIYNMHHNVTNFNLNTDIIDTTAVFMPSTVPEIFALIPKSNIGKWLYVRHSSLLPSLWCENDCF